MAEKWTLVTPLVKPPTVDYNFDGLNFSWTAQSITATFVADSGETLTCSATGQEARDLMVLLNKANMTNNTLMKRAFAWARSKGILGDGSVVGTPET